MADAYKNLAVSSVQTPPAPPASGTTLIVQTGQGGRFPAVPFNVTIWPSTVLPDPVTAEIVRVTARTGDQLTITRAQEGTVARAIVTGDLVAATLTARTIDNFAKLDAPQATFTGTVVGPYVAGTNGLLERNRAAPVGEWTTFPVEWRAGSVGPTMNNGTLTGRYMQLGRTVFVEILLMIGSTTVLPADPSAWLFACPVLPTVSVHMGHALAFHLGAGWYNGAILPANATQVLVLTGTTAAIANISNTVPWSWSGSDQLRLSWQYAI